MPSRIHMLLAALISAGCGTHAQSVCEKIGYCRTLTSEQEHTCEADVKNLATEASSSGCSPQYEAYFACADDRYQCDGNTPSFNGCEAARSNLDSCLANGRAANSCGDLENALSLCGPGTTPNPSAPPAPCDAAEVCSARCYLNNVADVCSPQPIEIARAAQCAQQCPL